MELVARAEQNQVGQQITAIQLIGIVYQKVAAILTNPPVRAGKQIVTDEIGGGPPD